MYLSIPIKVINYLSILCLKQDATVLIVTFILFESGFILYRSATVITFCNDKSKYYCVLFSVLELIILHIIRIE